MFLWGYAIGEGWWDSNIYRIDSSGMWDCQGIIDSPDKLLEHDISKQDYDGYHFEILVMTLDRKVVCAIVKEYGGSFNYEVEYPPSEAWYFQKFDWDTPCIDR